jgi:hypothetical protein
MCAFRTTSISVIRVGRYFLDNHYMSFYMVTANPCNVFDIHQHMKCTSTYWKCQFLFNCSHVYKSGVCKAIF